MLQVHCDICQRSISYKNLARHRKTCIQKNSSTTLQIENDNLRNENTELKHENDDLKNKLIDSYEKILNIMKA